MQMVDRPYWQRYGLAVASVLLATLLRMALQPILGVGSPYVTYFLAVLFTAWACGLGPALLAIGLGAMAALYLFVEPRNSLAITHVSNLIGLTLYLSVGIIGALLSQEMHSARRRAERHARLARQRQEELEQEMIERRRVEESLKNSQQQLALALESARMGVWEWDFETGKVNWSATLEPLHGLEPGTFAGTFESFLELVHEEDRELIMGALKRAAEETGDYDQVFRLKWPDGSTRWMEGKGRVFRDGSNKATRMVGLGMDITVRKQAEEALRKAEQRAITEYESLLERLTPLAEALGTARDLETIYRALLDFALASMPCIGIFIALYDPKKEVRTAAYAWGDGAEVDVSQLPPMPITTDGPNSRAVRTGEIIITNDYLTATKGHPSVKVGVDNGLLPRSSMSAPMAVMGRIVGTIEVQSYELAAYRAEHKTAMRMAANLAAVAIENVRLFELERTARATAEMSSRLKEEFLATLSHELRTPLTAVLGWLSLLRSGRLDERTSEQAFNTIERNAQVQAQLIEDILDVSRIITGKLRLDVRPLDLGRVVEAAIASIQPAIDAKQIKLETSLDKQASIIWGDANRLQQIIWNLLSNAVKFTPREGKIMLSAEREGPHTRIVVSDTGQGINPDFLPYVFERFRQADSTTTRTHSGLGLGLAIVRHLAEMHGGTITAESDGPGRGARFTLDLPVRAIQDEQQNEVMAYQANASSPEPLASLDGVSVLVVDNEEDARELISKVLEQCGARVMTAASAAEAIVWLETHKPDVMISDIGMPDEDGYALIRRIRALGRQRGGDLPAVALTAYVSEEDRQRALSAGYQEHIAKPVEQGKLASVIACLAGKNGKASKTDA